MRLHAHLAPVAILAVAACGGPLLSAEVEIERFCYVQGPVQIPYVPATVTTTVVTPTFSFALQMPPLLRAKGSEVEVRLLEAHLRPSTAGVDLSGIQTLRLEQVASAGPPPVTVALASYQRTGTGPVSEIVASGQDVDVAAAARAGTIAVRLQATGSLPTGTAGTNWNADLELCFSGRALMPYL